MTQCGRQPARLIRTFSCASILVHQSGERSVRQSGSLVNTVRLGLIGDNIAASKSPELHQVAGRLCGLTVTYDLLVPAELRRSFEELFAQCASNGYRGLNITYPYKARVTSHVTIKDADIRVIGACNTVVFGMGMPAGANTDYTGFIAAFRNTFGDARPGVVAVAGAGGVGRAIGFALAQLGAAALRLVDVNAAKAEALRTAIHQTHRDVRVEVVRGIEDAASGADGLVNATPLGMDGLDGTAFPHSVFARQRWAFDAVYTPVQTEFVLAARASGLSVMTGYELYFYQGIDAFRIFTGCDIDPATLRHALQPLHRQQKIAQRRSNATNQANLPGAMSK
jgi:shikimate dehydrogenase